MIKLEKDLQCDICKNCTDFKPVLVKYLMGDNIAIKVMCEHHMDGECHVKGFMPGKENKNE